ncbi:hypothetical protein CXG81DRAFT_15843 [Caulochytrium protostelioides]|uniref:Mitochondrial carrier n=1 Tax=Caulochytrium protostelioides TaxID=1555241 RepID=A0A4P9X0J9_9FUNG|nr:mitochondrial carrier [Caulochytrium protostelioides]RKO98502.1 hypothetical protein CXG81DRAFT_15843 [Caulochytrium protostelioides]|eukprot:RKO98502.1 hypothetical protein CXG81DRAFT_15843 [Caulochytrium protostelioides]
MAAIAVESAPVPPPPAPPAAPDRFRTVKELAAGSFGGIVQVLSGQPFDTVKVRLQTQSRTNPTYSGALDCVKKTIQHEGFKGFYKGTLTPLLGVGACVSIQFAALEAAKRALQARKPAGASLSIPELFLAGSLSGVANSILSGPIEHVRTRLQVQTGSAASAAPGTVFYTGPLDLARKVYRAHGIGAIYKGQGITIGREIVGYGTYFSTYEWLLQRHCQQAKVQRCDVESWRACLYGAISGYTLWLVIYPIDAVKSMLQTDAFAPGERQYANAFDCVRQTVRNVGVSGLYRGFGTCMLRAGPVNGVTFVAYEAAMRFLIPL